MGTGTPLDRKTSRVVPVHIRLCLALLLLACTLSANPALAGGGDAIGTSQTEAIEVGFLEEHCHHRFFAHSEPSVREEDSYRYVVRAAFCWQHRVWRTYDRLYEESRNARTGSYLLWRKRHWFMRDAKGSYHELVSAGPLFVDPSLFFAVQLLTRGEDEIETKARTYEFAGWFYDRVRPPQVLCTRPGFADVDEWRELRDLTVSDLPVGVLGILSDYIKAEVFPEGVPKEGFSSEHVPEVVSSARYSSNRHGVGFYQITLDDGDLYQIIWNNGETILGPVEEPICIADNPGEDRHWLLGGGLRFLCASDLNGDGTSEIVFWINRTNLNGYLLLNGSLQRIAVFDWT